LCTMLSGYAGYLSLSSFSRSLVSYQDLMGLQTPDRTFSPILPPPFPR
jgi:hypothetical protein